MLLHVRQNESVSVCDAKSMSEDVDDGSNAEVLRTVELRLLRRTSRLGDARPLQELASNQARVLDRRLIDRNHVVGQTVRNDETSTFVQSIRSVLQHINTISAHHPLVFCTMSPKLQF